MIKRRHLVSLVLFPFLVSLVLSSGCSSSGKQEPSLSPSPTETATDRQNTWVRTFEGPDYGAFFGIASTTGGNLLIVGTTNHLHVPPYSGDAIFMKVTPDGDVLWEKTWGGEGYEQALAVEPAEEGGFLVFGETDSYGVGDRDFFLLKLTEQGEEEWYRTYGRARREWPHGMLGLSNGDLLIYGFTESPVGSERNQYAVRVDPNGEVVWEYIGEGTTEEELVLDVLETVEGNLVLAVSAGQDGELVQLDPHGEILWVNRYDLPGWQFASQIANTDDGGYLLAGFSMSDSPRQADTWLARSNTNGVLEWEISFGESEYDDYATSMIRLKDGTYLIGAIANGMLLSRIDEDGNVFWRRTLLGESVYGAMALLEMEEGGYLVAGLIQLVNGRSYDAILLRTDAEGWVGE